MNNQKETDRSSVTRPASKVMLGGIFSLIGGLVLNVIVAAIFGAGKDMDAYLTAFVIPTYFQTVIFWNLSFVLIPIFIETEVKDGEDEAWALVGTFMRITIFILLFIAIIGSLFSTSIINAIAPGFGDEKSALAAQMLSVLMFTAPLTGLSTLTTGIQNARDRFLWPALAPAMGFLANAITLLVISRYLGPLALCWGYFASMVVQSAITFVPVLAHVRTKALPIMDERVKEIGKLVTPLILFGMVVSLSSLAERYFSSVLPDGQIAYMGYANKISNIFVNSLAFGIAAAIFPSMARSYSQEGIDGLSRKHDFGVRLTLAVALPVVAIIGAVAVPLVSVFFERGAFTSLDTLGVSKIVFAYLVGNVLFRMLSNIFQRSFYVLKDTRTQPIVSSIFVILFIVTARFFVDRWAYIGLVWAGVLRSGLGDTLLWILLLRKLPKENFGKILLDILKYCGAALAAYICGYMLVQTLAFLPPIFQLIVSGLLSASLYITLLYFLDLEMLKSILELVGIPFILKRLQKMKDMFLKESRI